MADGDTRLVPKPNSRAIPGASNYRPISLPLPRLYSIPSVFLCGAAISLKLLYCLSIYLAAGLLICSFIHLTLLDSDFHLPTTRKIIATSD
ncbi:hypothetical protein BDW66DRAFT_32366 [Aspergillus desertorum]